MGLILGDSGLEVEGWKRREGESGRKDGRSGMFIPEISRC